MSGVRRVGFILMVSVAAFAAPAAQAQQGQKAEEKEPIPFSDEAVAEAIQAGRKYKPSAPATTQASTAKADTSK